MELLENIFLTCVLFGIASSLLIGLASKGLDYDFDEIPKIATTLITTLTLSFLGLFICLVALVWI